MVYMRNHYYYYFGLPKIRVGRVPCNKKLSCIRLTTNLKCYMNLVPCFSVKIIICSISILTKTMCCCHYPFRCQYCPTAYLISLKIQRHMPWKRPSLWNSTTNNPSHTMANWKFINIHILVMFDFYILFYVFF